MSYAKNWTAQQTLELTGEGGRDAGPLGAAQEVFAGVGVALPNRAWVRWGAANTEVAAACGVTAATVGKWRRRFCELRLDRLSDDPRPDRPATITTAQVEEVLVATLESTPENATHWSRSKMAERSGLSESTVGRTWRAFWLQPHRAETFTLSNDPLFFGSATGTSALVLRGEQH